MENNACAFTFRGYKDSDIITILNTETDIEHVIKKCFSHFERVYLDLLLHGGKDGERFIEVIYGAYPGEYKKKYIKDKELLKICNNILKKDFNIFLKYPGKDFALSKEEIEEILK